MTRRERLDTVFSRLYAAPAAADASSAYELFRTIVEDIEGKAQAPAPYDPTKQEAEGHLLPLEPMQVDGRLVVRALHEMILFNADGGIDIRSRVSGHTLLYKAGQ